MPKPRWKWSTVAIVLATVALVFGPVFIPREVARWYLAAGANAYRLGQRAQGQHYLQRALAWDRNIMSDGDFWIAQMANTRSQTPDEKLDLLERAIKTDPSSAGMASAVAQLLAEEFDFERAVRAMKIALSAGQPQTYSDLNLLAYLRAQAGIELEDALKDIDRAIELVGPDPALLDTKAWVLHAMHRDREALELANKAIEQVEKQLGKNKTEPPAKKAADDASASEAITSGSEQSAQAAETNQTKGAQSRTARLRKQIQLAQARLGIDLWSLAIMRFHRLRIYEALQQPVEAEQDRQWLVKHGVPIVDELF